MGSRRAKKKAAVTNYNPNTRKRKWKASRKLSKITCGVVRHAWDPRFTVAENMTKMGLAYDPNQAIPIPLSKDALDPATLDEDPELKAFLENSEKKKKTPKNKTRVIEALERQAGKVQPLGVRLSQPEVEYCVYMLDKYVDNYKAMAKDKRNYYQDTPKQIKKKIRKFINIPGQYKEYLESKKQNVVEACPTDVMDET